MGSSSEVEEAQYLLEEVWRGRRSALAAAQAGSGLGDVDSAVHELWERRAAADAAARAFVAASGGIPAAVCARPAAGAAFAVIAAGASSSRRCDHACSASA